MSTGKQKPKRIDPVDGTVPDADAQAGVELVGEPITSVLSETTETRGRIAQFLHNWQELVIWKPLLFGLLLLAWNKFPEIDPKSGIDGFGDTFHLLLRALFVSALFFAVWLVKKTYFRELPADEEKMLWLRIQVERPVLALILDRLETGAILCAIAYILLR